MSSLFLYVGQAGSLFGQSAGNKKLQRFMLKFEVHSFFCCCHLPIVCLLLLLWLLEAYMPALYCRVRLFAAARWEVMWLLFFKLFLLLLLFFSSSQQQRCLLGIVLLLCAALVVFWCELVITLSIIIDERWRYVKIAGKKTFEIRWNLIHWGELPVNTFFL